MSDMPTATSVSTLFFLGRPFAVAWFVITTVVNTVYGEAVWFCAHVVEELLKRVPPTVANGYPSSSVILEVFPLCVVAAVLHTTPRAVCGSVGTPVFSEQAATRPSVACKKFVYVHGRSSTTITCAVKERFVIFFVRETCYSETTKDLVYRVNRIRHKVILRLHSEVKELGRLVSSQLFGFDALSQLMKLNTTMLRNQLQPTIR